MIKHSVADFPDGCVDTCFAVRQSLYKTAYTEYAKLRNASDGTGASLRIRLTCATVLKLRIYTLGSILRLNLVAELT